MLKPGKKNIGANIRELKADNMKAGKEKGAGGKVRPNKQILAIALSVKPMKEGMKHEKKESKKEEKKEHKKKGYKD